MPTQERTLFTATEAAALTRLPVKAVNNAIDKRTIIARGKRNSRGKLVRLVDQPALVYLSLERELVEDTTPAFRRKLFKAIGDALEKGAQTVAVGALMLDIAMRWREISRDIKDLRQAESLAMVDRETVGGAPIFRGTRIPIHLVAELLSKGETAKTLRRGYPRLTDEMIRLAPVYAHAHPLRGRPRKRPWRGRLKGRVVRVQLSDVAAK
jgi:uncharacterized protein (DUF433 family)